MEHGGANTFALAQHLFKLQGGGCLGADHQHLPGTVRGQITHQPLHARIEVPPGAGVAFKFLINLLRVEHVARAIFRRFTGAHNAGDFNRRLVLGRQRQFDGVQLAFREAFHAVTGVTEQHAAGAVTVHQHVDQLFTRGSRIIAVAVRGLKQRLNILLADQIAESVKLIIRETITGQQQRDGVRHRAVVFLLFNKLLKIVETVGIEQAQTGEVALKTQLLRRGGQEQNARYALGKLLNRHVFTAWRIFAPDQVVCFVDDQQIPFCVAQVLQALLAAAHEVQGTNDQLFGFKRVVRVVLGFGIALVVEQGEAQVKAAQHLDQPLVLQRFRHHNQHALGSAREQLLVQDHACFDGFTQAHFVSQQHARRMATAHVMGDIQLMGNKAGTLTAQAAPRHAVLLTLELTRAVAQGEAIHSVDLPGKQTVLRLAENQFAVEQHFTQDNIRLVGIKTRTDVGEQSILFFYVFNLQLPAFVAGHGVARIEHYAGNRGVIASVQAVFTGSREKEGNHARIDGNDGS